MMELWRKLEGWWRRDALEAELQEEIQTHLEMKASDSGKPRDARLQFGNSALIVEDSRRAWIWPRLEA